MPVTQDPLGASQPCPPEESCTICGVQLQGVHDTHNAEPKARGNCCSACNKKHVIPMRCQFPHTGDFGMPTGTTAQALLIARLVYKKLKDKDKDAVKDGTPPLWVNSAISHAGGGEAFISAAAMVVLMAFCRDELDPNGGAS